MPSHVKANSIRMPAIARSLAAAPKAVGAFCKGQIHRRGLPVRECLLGLSALASGNLAKAKIHFRQVLVKRANALIGLGRSREAISVYQWALRRNPAWTEARYGLATALVSVARCDEAVQEFDRLLSNDPNRLETYMGLGSAHHLAGRIDNAVEAWSKGMVIQQCLAHAASVPVGIRYLTGLWTNAVGHTSILDFFAKRHLLGLSPGLRYIVLAPPGETANAAYLALWRDYFEIITDQDEIKRRMPEARLAEDYPTVLSIDAEWHWLHDAMTIVQEKWDTSGRGPLLKLLPEQIQRGWEKLSRFGVPNDAWFVTLHVREAGLREKRNEMTEFRRNSNIVDYAAAIRRITDAGGWVIRLGDASTTPLPPLDRTVDYARIEEKSDWMDVFLMAQARFFIGTNSGPVWAAGTFGVPSLLTNWAPLGIQSHYMNTITLPQLLWSNFHNRTLRFDEQLQPPLGHSESSSQLKQLRVRSVPNTPEELAEAVDEMMFRTSGSWLEDPDDDKRQECFTALLRRSRTMGRSRIGRGFLRRHADLLAADGC
jgi:putative glycosyltransferase (TIGR04372 family)